MWWSLSRLRALSTPARADPARHSQATGAGNPIWSGRPVRGTSCDRAMRAEAQADLLKDRERQLQAQCDSLRERAAAAERELMIQGDGRSRSWSRSMSVTSGRHGAQARRVHQGRVKRLKRNKMH